MKQYTHKELYDWMTNKALGASAMRRAMFTQTHMQKYSETLGKLYFFWYDPKHKQKLPIYDRFPLVFPIESYTDGFLGINVHYLTKSQRTYLFTQLTDFAAPKKYTERTKLTLTYNLLQRAKGINTMTQPCIKRYLYSHVTSWFVEVPSTEWDRAAQLPVESFVVRK